MKICIPSRNLILATTIFLVFIVPLRAQNWSHDYWIAHNNARAAVGVSPLRWNNYVASYAQHVAELRKGTCATHSSGGAFGENIARGDGSMSGVEAVAKWVNEKFDYDYDSNACASGKVCSHYTQVVWRTSEKLGCARVRCDNGQILVICSYDPPGNDVGERPYFKEIKSSSI
ncbi:hypothetical protein Rs2_37765 [Raphanus sativus]|uniref:Pathogenesis-related protein 1-like n=1 Tax=Raphanus sativus TaxID=3726 RepID=A0A6J0KPY7_RAPSA|nr:pathogenesis-related protein 1-like [Raphanus sativus]KAJ4880710.1 hypothetical protein Rs2_37765 [Raphanus sativus]